MKTNLKFLSKLFGGDLIPAPKSIPITKPELKPICSPYPNPIFDYIKPIAFVTQA